MLQFEYTVSFHQRGISGYIMFGYVTVDKPELKIKEYERYRAFYCGLCRELGRRHGLRSRVTLNFDMNFLILLLTGLYDTDTEIKDIRCFAHVFKKQRVAVNVFTSYAADMNVLMAYYKCRDDWEDDRSIFAALYSKIIEGRVKKVEASYPEKAGRIRSCLKLQNRLESENNRDIDRVSGCFGNALAEVFAYRKDRWEEKLRRIGFYAGKFLYIMDAFDDFCEDIKKSRYNLFAEDEHRKADSGDLTELRDELSERAEMLLKLMMVEAAETFELLPIEENLGLLRNIIYSGVWNRYRLLRNRDE